MFLYTLKNIHIDEIRFLVKLYMDYKMYNKMDLGGDYGLGPRGVLRKPSLKGSIHLD